MFELQLFHMMRLKFFRYRSRFLMAYINQLLIPIIINGIFVLGLSETIANYDSMQLIAYVILSNLVFFISMENIENTIAYDIKESRLVYKILAPKSTLRQYFFQGIAKKLVQIIYVYLPAYVLMALFAMQPKFSVSLYAIVFTGISIIIGYCLSAIIGFLSFWMTEIWGLSAVKSLVLLMLSGAYFPLRFLPDEVYHALLLTPFPYISYIPASIILDGSVQNDFRLLVIALGWCVVLWTIKVVLWERGLKHFQGNLI